MLDCIIIYILLIIRKPPQRVCLAYSGFGGLKVACWPLEHKFAISNPAEAVGFFQGEKSSAHLPS
jgi:hypothetical protein